MGLRYQGYWNGGSNLCPKWVKNMAEVELFFGRNQDSEKSFLLVPETHPLVEVIGIVRFHFRFHQNIETHQGEGFQNYLVLFHIREMISLLARLF